MIIPAFHGRSGVYSLRVVDIFGKADCELENAVITSVTWERNGFGGCEFNVPTTDPKLQYLRGKMTQREIQIWRDPLDGGPLKLIFWGPVVRSRANQQIVTFQAQGLLWYFSRLTFGPPLVQRIFNPNFHDSTGGWVAAGTTTMSLSNSIKYEGNFSLKLVSSAQELDNFAFQQFTVAAGGADQTVLVAAAFQIVTYEGTAYIGPAYKERGLMVRRLSGMTVLEEVWTPITNSAARNRWNLIYAPSVFTRAGTTDTYEIRLYSPGGDIRWDVVSARYDESSGSVTAAPSTIQDVGRVLKNGIQYAQDAASNKPFLNIAPPGDIGINIHIVYPFSALGNIWNDSMSQLVSQGLCDVDVTWNDLGTTRTFNAYIRKGEYKPELTLELGANVGDFEVDEDGQSTAAAVVVIGNNVKDPTLGKVLPQCLLFGYAVDTAANGGVTLDAVVNASYETSLDGLQTKADTELARLKNPVKTLTVVTKENRAGSLIGLLEVGDTVPVIIDYGYVQENGIYRVAAMTLNPQTETMSVMLNIDLPGANALSPTQLGIMTKHHNVVTNVVRQLPPPPPSFRDLDGTDLSHITHGQGVVYDKSTGTLVPRVSGVMSATAPGSQTTSSFALVTFGDGPSLTAEVLDSGECLLTLSAFISAANSGNVTLTIDGVEFYDVFLSATNGSVSTAAHLTGLTPGAHVFSVEYASGTAGVNATFSNRAILFQPL